YDAAMGKFISADPLTTFAFVQGTNAYEFAANDPVNKSDPSGLGPVWGAGGTIDPKDRLPESGWTTLPPWWGMRPDQPLDVPVLQAGVVIAPSPFGVVPESRWYPGRGGLSAGEAAAMRKAKQLEAGLANNEQFLAKYTQATLQSTWETILHG